MNQDKQTSRVKKEERTKFTGTFAQAKNLIEKQIKIGNHIRDKKRIMEENRKKVHSVKSARNDEMMSQALKTKVYGGMSFDVKSQSVALQARGDTLSLMSNDVDFPKRNMSVGDKAAFSTKPNSVFKSFDNSRVNSTRHRTVFSSDMQTRPHVPSTSQSFSRGVMNQLLPPLNQTTFDYQYNAFQQGGGFARTRKTASTLYPANVPVDFSTDL